MQLVTVVCLFGIVANSVTGYAWKPITAHHTVAIISPETSAAAAAAAAAVSVASPPSNAYSNVFSLHRSHPGFVTKTFHESGAGESGEQEQVPSVINFGDERFGYKHADIEAFEKDQRCSVKKYAFNHDGVVHYENELPELHQFTICFWMRFTNHSGDHVILTYETEDEPRGVQLWIANANSSSFISMAIKGQQVYRLNYPLRVRKWHHMCSSWNGKTGEWQVWLKAERIGRGFHNSLVGHKIPANGKLYSGGASVTGDVAHGLHLEVTLVQIYNVALSAGKAHRDHKHHHAHHFDHEGGEIVPTTKAPPMIKRPQPVHALLANGQIATPLRLNLAQPQQGADAQKTLVPDQTYVAHATFVNGQIKGGPHLASQQLIGLTPEYKLVAGRVAAKAPPGDDQYVVFDAASHPSQAQYVDETETHIQFKRETEEATQKSPRKAAKEKVKVKAGEETDKEKSPRKRALVLLADGGVVEEEDLVSVPVPVPVHFGLKYDGLAEFGGQDFKEDLSTKMSIEDEITEHDREPAEEEVKAVMALCGSCDPEPFKGAIVFAWKDAHEHLDNALMGYSVGRCAKF